MKRLMLRLKRLWTVSTLAWMMKMNWSQIRTGHATTAAIDAGQQIVSSVLKVETVERKKFEDKLSYDFLSKIVIVQKHNTKNKILNFLFFLHYHEQY